MSEPSSDRPAGSSSAAPAPRRPRGRLQSPGYYIGDCGHRCPLVELAPRFYRIADCLEGGDDPQ
ncbi:MAG: hypothetical protein ACRDRO_00270 [Pseudonocardiaceae bacterium]